MPTVRRMITLLLVSLLGVYALLVLVVFLQQRALIYPLGALPEVERRAPEAPDLEVLQVQLDTARGAVEALLLHPPESAPRPAPLVVYTHGNGEVIDGVWRELVTYQREVGAYVLIPEYRGYGRSAGAPTQAGIVRDVVTFVDLVTAREEVDAARVVYHGYSLGGAVACAVAAERAPRAMILQSTLTSMGAVARRRGLPGFLARDPYDSVRVVRALDAPILITHGRQDRLLSFAFGEELARVARRGTFRAYDCGHVGCPRRDAAFWSMIKAHLRDAGVSPGDTPPRSPTTHGAP